MLVRFATGWMSLAAFVVLPLWGEAAERDIKTAVVNLLDVGADGSLSGRAAADEQYRAIEQMGTGDWRTEYAYAIVKINQGQYKDAANLVKQLSERSPASLQVLQTQVWLATLLRDYSGALAHLDKLSEQMAAAEALDTETAEQTARFMGRVFAFLEGPASGSANGRLVAAASKRVVQRLGEAERMAFDEAHGLVTDQFLALTETAEEKAQRAEQEAKKAREETLQNLAEEREQIDQRKDNVQEQRERLQQEFTEQMAALAKADQPLAAQLARLQAQGSLVSRDLAGIELELSRLDRLIQSEKDPFLRDSYLRESSRLQIIARRYSFDLAGLERQASVVVAQRNELLRQRLDAERTIGGQLGLAVKELGNLQQREKRTEGLERRARRARPGSGATRALTAQAAAFTTYEPFPYEQQRRWILEKFP